MDKNRKKVSLGEALREGNGNKFLGKILQKKSLWKKFERKKWTNLGWIHF